MQEDYPLNPEPLEFCPACRGQGEYYCQFTQEMSDCPICGGECYVLAKHYFEIKDRVNGQNNKWKDQNIR